MPKVPLTFNVASFLRLVVDIHGERIPLEVMIDTGLISQCGYGLKIPEAFTRYAYFTLTGDITVGDGRSVPTDYIPDAVIVEINGRPTNMVVPTMLMRGISVVGCMVHQRCKLDLDGPCGRGNLEF